MFYSSEPEDTSISLYILQFLMLCTQLTINCIKTFQLLTHVCSSTSYKYIKSSFNFFFIESSFSSIFFTYQFLHALRRVQTQRLRIQLEHVLTK